MSDSLTIAAPLSTTRPASTSPDISRKIAPILLGPLVNAALYGVLCVQTYEYGYNFPRDRRTLKCLACFTWLFETAQTTLNGADVYFLFMKGSRNTEYLKNPYLNPIDIPISHAIMSIIVQQYFCYRIWTSDRRLFMLCVIVSVLSILQFFISVWGGVKSLILRRFIVSRMNLYLWVIPSAVVDVLIAFIMVLLFSRTRMDQARFTNSLIIRIVRFTIETNALTAGATIFCLILAVAFPHDGYFMFMVQIIGKIYSNTLLVNLNSRVYFCDNSTREDHLDSVQVVASEQSHHSAMTSLRFAQVGSHAYTNTVMATVSGSTQLRK